MGVAPFNEATQSARAKTKRENVIRGMRKLCVEVVDTVQAQARCGSRDDNELRNWLISKLKTGIFMFELLYD